MATRDDLRTVAIAAHVDAGKSTLTNALLQQTGTWAEHETVVDRATDRMDQERERGITIVSSDVSVRYRGVKLNIVDTPGHQAFSAATEASIVHMSDGIVLLVDSSEGVMPGTRSYLRIALHARKPIILVINKVDRPDARLQEVIDEVEELFLDLDADEDQIDFPILYAIGRDGRAGTTPELSDDLAPLFDTILEYVPAPEYDEDAPLQALVTGLSSDPYFGRIASCRIKQGTIRKGQTVAWMHEQGVEQVKVKDLQLIESLDRVSVEEAGPGEIAVVAGIGGITLGDTLGDPSDPRPLPRIKVDEPNLGVTIGINTSPLAGKSGKKLTARQIKDRLDAELVGNVAFVLKDTESDGAWEMVGRGELQLAVLIESMRREGFEMTIGKPRVVTKEIDGKLHEPMEHVVIDVPEDYLGVVTQLMALRKGTMRNMGNHGTGWVRLEFDAPARGLLGFRTNFLTETRGTGIIHQSSAGWTPWMGDINTRQNGTLVSDRAGVAAGFSINRLQERGVMFIHPGEELYEGMIVGENARQEDMVADPTRAKQQTNIRSAGADDAINLVPPTRFSLEQALEFIDADECVEVTPEAIRLRKVLLTANERKRAKK